MYEWDEYGEYLHDDVMLVLLNAHHEMRTFKLPGPADGPRWDVMLDSNTPLMRAERSAAGEEIFEIQPRSLILLRWPKEAL